MKIFRAAALLALLTGPAHAQLNNWIPEAKSRTPEEIERDRANDKAYRDSLRKIPDAKAASDPWGSARVPDGRKPPTQSRQPQAKSSAPAPR